MKKTFLLLLILLFAVNIYAQSNVQNEYNEWKPSQDEYQNFDISKYTTPDIVRNQLDINFYFHSNFHSDNSHVNYSLFGDMAGKYESSSFTGNILSSFSHYINTRKKISSLVGNLSLEGDYSSKKQKYTYPDLTTTDNKLSNNKLGLSLYLSWSNKWYFSTLFFLNYGIDGNISYNSTQNKIENPLENRDEKQKEFSLNISPQLGVGYGRIENVQDARQAVYIANALSKKKVLTRNLSNDELSELSQIISTVKNKRFLDSRLHLMEEITSLDTFFVNNNLLADNGASYFTTLYDMWQYGELFSRKSGYEISFVVRPYYEYKKIKYTPIMRDVIYNSDEHIISLNFSYEKPFKLNWQHSVSAAVFGDFYSSSEENKQTDNNYKNSTKYRSFAALANYSLGYYPNTRTNIRIRASQQISKEIDDDENSSTYYYAMLDAGLYYYFSPNLRLTGNCGLMYSPSRDKGNEGSYFNRDVFSSSVYIQLTYFIF